MNLMPKLIAKRIMGKVLSIYLGAREILRRMADRLYSLPGQPIVLYQPQLDDVLLIHRGEPIDLLVSLRSSIQLMSKEGASITFRRAGGCLVIQSEGLKRVLEL